MAGLPDEEDCSQEVDVPSPGLVFDLFCEYWKKEVAPFDEAERFFRLASNPESGVIGRTEMRPFIEAIAERRPQLSNLPAKEKSGYVDTVLAITFYKHSQHGVIRLPDLRGNVFVQSINLVDKMGELPRATEKKVREYWSLKRNKAIHAWFVSLCWGGQGVCAEALQWFSYDRMTSVGLTRAKRVVQAGLRLFPCRESSGYGQPLDYDAFVSFYLCEVALVMGTCTKRDVRYCFDLVDVTGHGRFGVSEITPFRDEMVESWQPPLDGKKVPRILEVDEVGLKNFDALGLDRGRDHVSLQDMLQPDNVVRAGECFWHVFSAQLSSPLRPKKKRVKGP